MKSSIFKQLVIAGSLLAAGQAFAAPEFTFDASGTGKTSGATTFTADTLSGSTSELVTFANNGATASASGILVFTSAADTNISASPVKGFGTLGTYGLYLTFSLTDHYTGTVGGVNTYALDSLTYNFYIDSGNDSTYTQPTLAGAAPTVNQGATADTLLATGSLVFGTATTNSTGGATLISTETVSTLTLNTQYFTVPSPFYSLVLDSFSNNSGNFQSAQDVNGNGYATIKGVPGAVTFSNVPEPSTVALFGIAAVGLGLSARRRRKA